MKSHDAAEYDDHSDGENDGGDNWRPEIAGHRDEEDDDHPRPEDHRSRRAKHPRNHVLDPGSWRRHRGIHCAPHRSCEM